MLAGKLHRRFEPVEHVCRATQDDGVIAVEAGDLFNGAGLSRSSRLAQGRGDALGDAGGSTVPGGLGDQDLHGVSVLVGDERPSSSASRRNPIRRMRELAGPMSSQ